MKFFNCKCEDEISDLRYQIAMLRADLEQQTTSISRVKTPYPVRYSHSEIIRSILDHLGVDISGYKGPSLIRNRD